MSDPTIRPEQLPVNANVEVSGWAGARGDKWRAHLGAMEATLRPVDSPLLRALELGAPARIADIGCGGGGTTLELLRQAPLGSIVHGFDISPSLVEIARGRIAPGTGSIAFEVADVANASPPDGGYTRLVSRFGVMFFDDPPRAFENLARWLSPGGRFAFAVWGETSANPWMSSVTEVVSSVIEVPPAQPDAPGAFRYADSGRLLGLLDRAGFGSLEARAWRGSLPVGGGLPAAEAASFALASYVNFAELLAGAGEEARRSVHRALTARFAQHEEGGVVRMAASVHIVTGTRL